MNAKHKYSVTVETVTDESDMHACEPKKMIFEVETHDDIFDIVNRLRERTDIDPHYAESFGLGLKLFAEVLLKNKDNALFSPLLPHFKDFMSRLKK